MVETLETATTWSNLGRALPARVGATRCGAHAPLVLCHVSHLYPTGASLYFTFLARQQRRRRARAVARGQGARRATRSSPPAARSPTTTRSAATTRPWLRREVGDAGLAALRAVKAELDPRGIMNPGKLLPG